MHVTVTASDDIPHRNGFSSAVADRPARFASRVLLALMGSLLFFGGCSGGLDLMYQFGGPDDDVTHVPLQIGTEIRLETGGVPGVNTASWPQIDCVADRVYVVWMDDRNGGSDIYFTFSSNGGVTWLPAPIRINTAAAGAATAVQPEIASLQNFVYVVWYDDRNGGQDIFFNSSSDGGATWRPADIRLDTDVPGAADSQKPVIACSGNSVYVVWQDARGPSIDIYCNFSSDRGDTWEPADIRVDHPVNELAQWPAVAAWGDNVHVVWGDSREGGLDPFYNGSLDQGLTWQAADVDLNLAVGPTSPVGFPRVRCEGSSVFTVWSDDRDPYDGIYLSKSDDNGLTWSPANKRLDDALSGGDSINPQIDVTGGSVYVVWEDDRDFQHDIYLNYSLDGGSVWQSSGIRLDTDGPGTNSSLEPKITARQGDICIVWHDGRNGIYDIYCNFSQTGGLSWQPNDIRLDTDIPNPGRSTMTRTASSDDKCYIIWLDERHGNPNIFFNSIVYGYSVNKNP